MLTPCEVEHLGPAFVTSTFTRGQLGLNVDQAADFIGVRISTVESKCFLTFGIFGKNRQNVLLGKNIPQFAGSDGFCPISGAVAEPAAALTNCDTMLLQELSSEILKIGRLSQNGTDVFAQGSFLGFIFGLPDGQAGSGVPGVGEVEAALAASLRPILSFGDAVAGTF